LVNTDYEFVIVEPLNPLLVQVPYDDKIFKYNPHHDAQGRFASGGAGGGAPAGAGKDLLSSGVIAPGNALDEKLNSMTDNGYNYEEQFIQDIKKQDEALAEIYAMQGFNGKPTSVNSWEEFDAMESPVIEGGTFDKQKLFNGVGGGYDYEKGNGGNAKTPITELSRGFQDGKDVQGNPVTADMAIDSFVNGDTHWAGKGLAGNGTYVGMKAPVAAGYTNNDDLVGAISFKLDSTARVGSFSQISNEMLQLKNEGKLPKSLNDVGRFAAAKGFDAYVHDSTKDAWGDTFDRTIVDMAIVLNRSKVVFGPSIKTADLDNHRWAEAGATWRVP
jgi:hypothetical protein